MTQKNIFLIVLIAVAATVPVFCMERSDNITLEDALVRAVRDYHLKGRFLEELKSQLQAIARTRKIDRNEAFEAIEAAQLSQVIEQTAVPVVQQVVAPPLRPQPLAVGVQRPLELEQMVDRKSSGYRDFVEVRRQMAQSDVLKRSALEDTYIQRLRKSSQSPWFYTGDELWYYLAIRNLLPLMSNDSIHGPLYTRFDDGRPLSGLKLKNPFLYLVSFNQIENVCGFSALANGIALNAQRTAEKVITFAETRNRAQAAFTNELASVLKKAQCGGVEYAAATDIVETAQKVGLNPEKTLEIMDEQTVTFLHKALKSGRVIERNTDIQQKLKNNERFFVIYNIGGGHWAVLAVIKSQGVSTFYLLNSSNAPLKDNDHAVKLIRYMDELLTMARQSK